MAKHYIIRSDGVVQSYPFLEKDFRKNYREATPHRPRVLERKFKKRIRVYVKRSPSQGALLREAKYHLKYPEMKVPKRKVIEVPMVEEWITCSLKYNNEGSIIDCSVTMVGSELECKDRLKKYVNEYCFRRHKYSLPDWSGHDLILNLLTVEMKCERAVDETKEDEEKCTKCPGSRK